MTALKPRHIRALKQAVADADSWRGSLIGSYPDDEQSQKDETDRLAVHDAKIALMREAVSIIEAERKPG